MNKYKKSRKKNLCENSLALGFNTLAVLLDFMTC